MPSSLERLCAWYRAQCDGDWEHRWGVKIGTLDNPGWFVDIDLHGTRLEHVPFEVHKEHSEHETEWIICKCDGQTFSIGCGPERLDAALRVFLDWADSLPPSER